MSKVGFVGLGIMGAPMAAHLVAAGHELHAAALFARAWRAKAGKVLDS